MKTAVGPFSYGVSGFVGTLLITKMRLLEPDFNDIEKYLKSNFVHYTIQRKTTKILKVGKRDYVHFVMAASYHQLAQVKIILRKNKISKLNEEISQLKLF